MDRRIERHVAAEEVEHDSPWPRQAAWRARPDPGDDGHLPDRPVRPGRRGGRSGLLFRLQTPQRMDPMAISKFIADLTRGRPPWVCCRVSWTAGLCVL